jgi:hypothetical protein
MGKSETATRVSSHPLLKKQVRTLKVLVGDIYQANLTLAASRSIRCILNGQEAGIRTRTVRFTGGDAAITPQSWTMASTAGIAPTTSTFAWWRSNLTELRGQMASVVGLAPTTPGLKGRLLELLCIHGQAFASERWKTQGGCSRASLNPVVSNPPWR